MRINSFEIYLQDTHGNKLPEEHLDGRSYAIATAGEEYSVKILVHKDSHTNHFISPYLRIGLYVDGVDVQYWKRIDTTITTTPTLTNHMNSISTTFYGYKKNNEELCAFIFAVPRICDHTSYQESIKASGSIKVEIYEAEITAGTFHNVSNKYEVPGIQKLSSDGKFYMKPSVTTIAGRDVSSKESFIPLIRWRNKSSIPLATLTLYYHSKEMLCLLKSLKDINDMKEDERRSEGGCRSKGGVSGSSRKRSREVVDLSTSDDDVQQPPSRSVDDEAAVDSVEVEYVEIPREVQLLDITDDTAAGPIESTMTKPH